MGAWAADRVHGVSRVVWKLLFTIRKDVSVIQGQTNMGLFCFGIHGGQHASFSNDSFGLLGCFSFEYGVFLPVASVHKLLCSLLISSAYL